MAPNDAAVVRGARWYRLRERSASPADGFGRERRRLPSNRILDKKASDIWLMLICSGAGTFEDSETHPSFL